MVGSNNSETSKFDAIARESRTDPAVLTTFLKYPEGEDRVPYLWCADFEDGTEVLGPHREDRQVRASLLLLLLWARIGDKQEVESSQLGTALKTSSVNPENRKNMYQALDDDGDPYFSRNNQGKVSLTHAGEVAAVEEVSRLAEKLADNDE
ncbi:hypothetical protein ACFQL9_13265 [Halobaculum lipolyticum]|uniref:Uncharacterized protein n=1 Tax=Halobaculum lipolyticum TaxID=3032001 RepID=A0ABD5WFQ0_9EURY